MPPPVSAAARRLPTLLLLGLLALLPWGQCAGLLYPGAHTAPTLTGYAISTDSLRDTPATLYLTLVLHNNLRQPVLVHEVAGAILFNGRAHPFSATAQLHDTPLAPGASLRQAVAVRVLLAADSLALLRKALQTSPRPNANPHLEWRASFATKRFPDSRTLRNLQPYLPPLAH